MGHYAKALQANANNALAQSGMGVALAQSGRLSEARNYLERAVKIRPNLLEAHFNLANLLLQTGQPGEAIRHLQKVLDLQPGLLAARNSLAWTLATSPDAEIRNGREALALARQTANASGGRDPVILDTLAAALAECGSFYEALATARRALELAQAQGNTAVADALQRRIKLYEMNSPFREPASAGGH